MDARTWWGVRLCPASIASSLGKKFLEVHRKTGLKSQQRVSLGPQFAAKNLVSMSSP